VHTLGELGHNAKDSLNIYLKFSRMKSLESCFQECPKEKQKRYLEVVVVEGRGG
jgi:hypothetical protein